MLENFPSQVVSTSKKKKKKKKTPVRKTLELNIFYHTQILKLSLLMIRCKISNKRNTIERKRQQGMTKETKSKFLIFT